MKKIKLILGLGNPDKEYQETRHNVGFMLVDYIAEKLSDKSVILVKPETYVNKTGLAVIKLKKNYKVKSEQILIIQDDLDIPFGNSKLSFDKNSGGHKGIESVIKHLKTKKFYRLRIGLATPALKKARQQSDKKRDEFVTKFVLSKFSPSEREKIKKVFKEAYEKILMLI